MRELERSIEQKLLLGAKQARSANGGKRYGAEKLRVVIETVALVRLRPSPVEHVLAIRMRLREKRHRPDQGAGAADKEELRQPAGLRRGAARVDERGEKLMPHEGPRAGERVPFRGVHAAQRVDYANGLQTRRGSSRPPWDRSP